MVDIYKKMDFHKVSIFVFVFLSFLMLSLSIRSNTLLIDIPLTEDGYYLLSVSRNIALGRGLTVDGTHLTNGFQPLFAVLLSPIYMIFGGDRYESLRGVIVVHWAFHLIA